MNPGGVRSAIMKGVITYADVVHVIPFENVYVSLELKGMTIRELLEFGVTNLEKLNVMQVAGIKIVFDLKRQPYDRIVDLKVICQACDIPHYGPIDDNKFYRIIVPEFLAHGGDGYTMIPKYSRNSVTGPRDVDAVSDYINKTSPIRVPPLKGRITFI